MYALLNHMMSISSIITSLDTPSTNGAIHALRRSVIRSIPIRKGLPQGFVLSKTWGGLSKHRALFKPQPASSTSDSHKTYDGSQ